MVNVLPRHFIYGVILFTLIIVGGVGMMASLNDHSASRLAESEKYAEFNRSFNTFSDVTSNVDSLEGSLGGTDPDVKDGTFLGDLIRGSWTTLKTIGASFTFMDTALEESTDYFGVPAWIPQLIAALITVMLLFAIWSAVFQREI